MTMFVPFVEHNDWEGETWTAWLQLDGNELELIRLKELISKYDLDEVYELDLNDMESEEVVDRTCARAGRGYNYSDSKTKGKFVCPDDTGEEFEQDHLYKLNITSYFKE